MHTYIGTHNVNDRSQGGFEVLLLVWGRALLLRVPVQHTFIHIFT